MRKSTTAILLALATAGGVAFAGAAQAGTAEFEIAQQGSGSRPMGKAGTDDDAAKPGDMDSKKGTDMGTGGEPPRVAPGAPPSGDEADSKKPAIDKMDPNIPGSGPQQKLPGTGKDSGGPSR